jgi:hypothetical protein
MSKNLQISLQGQKSVLSKEQKRYNNLLSAIKRLQKDIEEIKRMDLELRKIGETKVTPVEKKVMSAQKEFIILMDKSAFVDSLKKKQTQRYHAIIAQEAESLLNSNIYCDDEEVMVLYDRHSEDDMSWQAQMEADEAEQLDFAAQMANHMFGIDLDPEDMKDPEKLMHKMNARKEEMMAEQEGYEAKRQERKKTAKQLEAEANRKAVENAVNRTAKQIYHDLVKHFHPDKEPDETLRIQKTEIMKEITAAYEANNHLKLMELQINLLAGENVFAKFDEKQLKYFNDILKKQKEELEMEYEINSPYSNGNIYAQLFDTNPYIMNRKIKEHIEHFERYMHMVNGWIELIRTKEGFKDLVKNYELDDDSDDDFFDPDLLLEFFRSNGRR